MIICKWSQETQKQGGKSILWYFVSIYRALNMIEVMDHFRVCDNFFPAMDFENYKNNFCTQSAK